MPNIVYCPVCGRNIRFQKICSSCGYATTWDYEMYPTLSPLSGNTESIQAKRLEREKQQIRVIMDEILHTRAVQVKEQEESLREEYVKQRIRAIKELEQTDREAIEAKRKTNWGGLFSKSEAEGLASPKSQKALINITGNTCTFGSYPQDANGTVSPILWDVLEVDQGNNKVLLISKYALVAQPYNTSYTDITWETCSLREWLNSDFLVAAFTDEEQAIIQKVTVSADKNPDYKTDQGNNTRDKVFLLSISEAKKYFSSDENRKCVPTAYAIKKGAWTSDSYKLDGKATCIWWLRSVGYTGSYASNVYSAGYVRARGSFVALATVGVRPALWVDLES